METRSKTVFIRTLFAIFSAFLFVTAGCHKSQREIAEEQALERHKREAAGRPVMANPAMRAAMSNYLQSAEGVRMQSQFEFLGKLKKSGQMPGIPKDTHGTLRQEKGPEDVTPDGGYTQEFHLLTSDNPPTHYHIVIAQASSNGPFELKKVWRADGSGKVIEEYPIQ
jgi:hypothetical protein